MNVWRSPDQYRSELRSVVSVGNFDGVHRGHAALVSQLTQKARADNCVSLLLTFEPHTRSVIDPVSPVTVISTFDEKAVLLERLGVDHMVRIDFTSEYQNMTARMFVENVLNGMLKAKTWVMGRSHTFGSDRMAAGNSLRELLCRNDITELPLTLLADERAVVSSTGIRACVAGGDVRRAVAMLGHPYLILARRIYGLGVGKTLGFPTLNFRCPPADKVLPPPGVYAARLQYGPDQYPGALYLGTCPTLASREAHFEMHLFERPLREPAEGEEARLWVYDYVRPDMKLSGETSLVKQIGKDVNHIQEFFREGDGLCL